MFIFNKKMLMLAVGVAVVGSAVLAPESFAMTNNKEVVTMVGGAKMYSSKDIVSNVINAPNLTTLVAAVKAAGLVETLQGDGPFTVFGPDDNAFAKVDAKTIEFLLKPENKAELAKILTYHVVAGNYPIAALKNKQVLTTVQGGKLTVSKTFKKIKGQFYSTVILTDENGTKSKIITRNVMQKNGVAHVVDTVLMPKADDKMMKKDDMMEKDDMMKAEEMKKQEMMKSAGMFKDYNAEAVKIALMEGKKVALFFHASRCPVCVSAAKDFMSMTLADNSVIFKVDFDTATDLKKKYGVTGQHTYVFLDKDMMATSVKQGMKSMDVITMLK